MKNILYFENYISNKVKDTARKQFIGDIIQPVEIRIDVEAIGHALNRQYRHGVVVSANNSIESAITKDEILDTIENAVEELTISLMQDKFNIYNDNNEINRFIIRNKLTNLNIICELEPGDLEFKLTVITVMKKENFKPYRDQFVIEV